MRVGGSEGSEGSAHLADVVNLDRATRRHDSVIQQHHAVRSQQLLDPEHTRRVRLGQVDLVRARGAPRRGQLGTCPNRARTLRQPGGPRALVVAAVGIVATVGIGGAASIVATVATDATVATVAAGFIVATGFVVSNAVSLLVRGRDRGRGRGRVRGAGRA